MTYEEAITRLENLTAQMEKGEITIDQMAATCGTIQHEIAIAFSHRMPRLYV